MLPLPGPQMQGSSTPILRCAVKQRRADAMVSGVPGLDKVTFSMSCLPWWASAVADSFFSWALD